MSRPRQHLGGFLRDRKGVAAIEFAFIFPVLLFLLLGIFEYGRYMYTYNTLQFACEQAARWGRFHMTGTDDDIEKYARGQLSGLSNVTFIRPEPDKRFINPTTATVTVEASVEFNFIAALVTPITSMTIKARSKM